MQDQQDEQGLEKKQKHKSTGTMERKDSKDEKVVDHFPDESTSRTKKELEDAQNAKIHDAAAATSADKYLAEIQAAIRKCVQPHWKEPWKAKMFALADKIKFRELKPRRSFLQPFKEFQECEVSFSVTIVDKDEESKDEVRESEVKMQWDLGKPPQWSVGNLSWHTKLDTVTVKDIHSVRNFLYPDESIESGMPLNLFFTVFRALLSGCSRFKGLSCQDIRWNGQFGFDSSTLTADEVKHADALDVNFDGDFQEPVNQLFIRPQHFNKELLDGTFPKMKSEMQPGKWFDGRDYGNYLFLSGEIQRVNWINARPLIDLQQMRRISKILFAYTPENQKKQKLLLAEDAIRHLRVVTNSKSRFAFAEHPEQMITSNLFSISPANRQNTGNAGSAEELQLIWRRTENEWKCELKRPRSGKSGKPGKPTKSMFALEEDPDANTSAISGRGSGVQPKLEDWELVELMEWYFLNRYECTRNTQASPKHESATCCSRGGDRNIGNFCQQSNFADFGYPSGPFVSNFTFVRAIETFETTLAALHKLLTLPTPAVDDSNATNGGIEVAEKPAVLIKEVVDIICSYHHLACPSPLEYNRTLADEFRKLTKEEEHEGDEEDDEEDDEEEGDDLDE